MELSAEIHSTSAQDVEKLMTSAAFLEAMMKAQQPQAGTGKFEVHADQGTLHLSLTIPEEVLKKAMDAQAARIKSALAASQPKTAPVIAVPQPASGSQVPRVLNPDGGTAVITLPGRP